MIYLAVNIRNIIFVFFLGIILLLSGCATQKGWQYSSSSYPDGPLLIDKTLAVPPLTDSRSNKNSNMAGMYLIPLAPYGWQEFNTPEGVNMHINSTIWQWRANEDIAKATAEELDHSNVFKEVFFTNRASEGELILQGIIKSTKYDGKMITYGLSVFGPTLWFIGFPATLIENELNLTFQLKSSKKGHVLWERSYSEKQSDLSWLYSLKSDFNYSSLLKTILTKVANDLKQDSLSINNKLKGVST